MSEVEVNDSKARGVWTLICLISVATGIGFIEGAGYGFLFFGVVTFMLVQLKSALSNGDNDE